MQLFCKTHNQSITNTYIVMNDTTFIYLKILCNEYEVKRQLTRINKSKYSTILNQNGGSETRYVTEFN